MKFKLKNTLQLAKKERINLNYFWHGTNLVVNIEYILKDNIGLNVFFHGTIGAAGIWISESGDNKLLDINLYPENEKERNVLDGYVHILSSDYCGTRLIYIPQITELDWVHPIKAKRIFNSCPK